MEDSRDEDGNMCKRSAQGFKALGKNGPLGEGPSAWTLRFEYLDFEYYSPAKLQVKASGCCSRSLVKRPCCELTLPEILPYCYLSSMTIGSVAKGFVTRRAVLLLVEEKRLTSGRIRMPNCR